MARKTDPARKLISAAMELATLRPWHEIAYRDIVTAAGLKLDEAYELAPSKAAILTALSRLADQAVLAEPAAFEEGTARERLFDVLMRRFDALKPYRAGLASVVSSSARDPAAALAGACAVDRAMGAMLTAAGISAEGLRGALRSKALSGIWLATLRDFLRDETEDLSHTMAALDRRLARAEALAGRFHRRPPAATAAAEATKPEAPMPEAPM